MKQMQVVYEECGRLPNAVLGLPLEMSAVNTNGARAAPMQSPCAAACRAVPAEHWMGTDAKTQKNEWMDGWMQNTVHGLLNAVPWCGCLQGSPCNLRDDPGAHGIGRNGANANKASRHGVKAW